MTLVLDASATLAWIFPHERTPAIRAVIEQVLDGGALVPSLWRLEVANILRTSIRRGQFSLGQRDEILAGLLEWPITVDDETDSRAWTTTTRLSDRFGLTTYDAAYLELADRRGLPLATLDRQLIGAAASLGVPVCP